MLLIIIFSFIEPFSVFLSAGGMDCVEKHKDDIFSCLNRSIPGLFQVNWEAFVIPRFGSIMYILEKQSLFYYWFYDIVF